MSLNKQDRLYQQYETALRKIILRDPHASRTPWQRRYGSMEEYLASIQPNREQWSALLRFPAEWQSCSSYEIATASEAEKLITLKLTGGLELEAFYRQPGPAFQPPHPLVVLQHGMGGSIDMLIGKDDTQPPSYHGIGRQLADQGYAILAPALLNSFAHRNRINRMALLLASSIWALEVQAIRLALQAAVQHLPVDDRRIAMWGHSMGGAYALYTMPIEQRFKVGIISAWFNDRPAKMVVEDPRYSCFLSTAEEHAFLPSLLQGYSDCDLVSLICPRPLLIQTGERDSISSPGLVSREFSQAKFHYSNLAVAERIAWDRHSGGHEINVPTGIAFLQKWL